MVLRRITRGWPPKRRTEQAQRCRKSRPSQHSTGPKTRAGKAICANNAYKHGLRSAEMEQIERLLCLQKAYLSSAGKSDFKFQEFQIVPSDREAGECGKKLSQRPKGMSRI